MEIPNFISNRPQYQYGSTVYLNKNLYYEPISQSGRPALIGTPGHATYMDAGDGVIRGLFSRQTKLYAIVGNLLRTSVYPAVFATKDTITGSTGPVWMEHNGLQLCTVDITANKLFIYTDLTDTGVDVDPHCTPGGLTYQDGFFVVFDDGTNLMYSSNYLDGTLWTATDVATKEGYHDKIVAIKSINQLLHIFGVETSEIWAYNASSLDFPFLRVPGAILRVGCSAKQSLAYLDDSIFWLNERYEVCRTRGYGYEVVSDPLVTELLQYYGRAWYDYMSAAIGYGLVWNGHPWYVLRWAYFTLVYDVAAAAAGEYPWFQWSTGTGNTHIGNCCVLHQGKYRLGTSASDGKIYTIDETQFTDDKTINEAYRLCRLKNPNGKQYFFKAFEVDMKTDVGAYRTKTSTTLTAAANPGATSITVASITDMAIGDTVSISRDVGAAHNTTISSAPAGSTVPITDPMPSLASSGKPVICYDKDTIDPGVTLGLQNLEVGATIETLEEISVADKAEVRWSALGASKDMVFKVSLNNGAEKQVYGASVEVTESL